MMFVVWSSTRVLIRGSRLSPNLKKGPQPHFPLIALIWRGYDGDGGLRTSRPRKPHLTGPRLNGRTYRAAPGPRNKEKNYTDPQNERL